MATSRMTLKAVQAYCAQLPAATGDIKWGADYVFSVGDKMFAVACNDQQGKPVVSFKVEDERFLELTDRQGFIPAPYLARAKWVQVEDLSAISASELKSLIARSHQLVAAKLSGRLRAKLGIADLPK